MWKQLYRIFGKFFILIAEWIRYSQYYRYRHHSVRCQSRISPLLPSYEFREKIWEIRKFGLNHLIKCMQFPTHPRVLTDQVAG